ncbi:MAG TPA: Sir2 family NAD-dependent protein deacetylase [Candidatus Lumbricidophila sp.]|nr:Sir2 family NAD-dependent protein deacetylase [Candidatus Lumbricidophila sp.]
MDTSQRQFPEVRFEHAARTLRGLTVAVVTGAGISTESGIPDYRGTGTPVRESASLGTFLKIERVRKRYWVGVRRTWNAFRNAEPNAAHLAVARLEAAGLVTGVVTQNIDGLHRRAGSMNVVEVHGVADVLHCVACGHETSATWFMEAFDELNVGIDLERMYMPLPRSPRAFAPIDVLALPACLQCGGVLKPDVVFFGEVVPDAVLAACDAIVTSAQAVLVAGSSLMVNSGMRLVELARKQGKPVVVVNLGPTRADQVATVKVPAGTSEVLPRLAAEVIGEPEVTACFSPSAGHQLQR